MSQEPATITEEEFNERFGVRAVHLRLSKYDSEIGVEELRARQAEGAFVKRYGNRFIWTLVEGRDGDLYLLSGFQLIRRLGLIASHQARPWDLTIMVHVDDSLRDEMALAW